VGLLNDLDDGARVSALDRLRGSLVAHTEGSRVRYDSAAWLVTARRA
jgi:hypothetical protein